MKVQDCRNAYEFNSGKASDVSRNLGFAGLALVWAFRVSSGESVTIPLDLRCAGVFLVVGLAMDFFQYVVATIVWGVYHRLKEKELGSSSKDFGAPGWINYPANAFFYLKLTAISVAYVLVVRSMFGSFWT